MDRRDRLADAGNVIDMVERVGARRARSSTKTTRYLGDRRLHRPVAFRLNRRSPRTGDDCPSDSILCP